MTFQTEFSTEDKATYVSSSLSVINGPPCVYFFIYFFIFIHVDNMVIIHKHSLAKFGFKQDVKVKKL